MSRQRGEGRLGKFFLKPRGKAGIFYVCWYEPSKRQTDGFSTDTSDLHAAEIKLAEHVAKVSRPVGQADASLAEVLNDYWFDRGEKLPSASTQRDAMRSAIEIWGNPMVSEITLPMQLRLVARLREQGLADDTISTRLGRIFTAINYAKDNGRLLAVPTKMAAEHWTPHLRNRERVLTLEELAKLFNACGPAERDGEDAPRYEREHWWRFLILAIGTLGRPTAVLQLTKRQVNLQTGVIDLNPPGRQQNKKRRAKIAMAPTLASWVKEWGPGYLITYYDQPLATLEFFDTLREAAGLDEPSSEGSISAYTIRHTVRTWLAEKDVPDWEADQMMGHRGEGSHSGARYKHFRPKYLRTAAEAIEQIYEQLAPLVTVRDLLKRDLPAQPTVLEALARGNRVADSGVVTRADLEVAELLGNLERETRLELATSTLARLRSTN